MRITEWNGWELREAGPADAERSALLLPGGFSTAAFYDDVLADPRLPEQGVRFVAATPPGFGGRPAPGDVSMENYARLTGELAKHLGADVLVGHSLCANVAIEAAAAGLFTGPIVLLSPTFSRPDEERDVRLLDRISRIPLLGVLPWLILPLLLSGSFRRRLPPDRYDKLVAEARKTDLRLARRIVLRYFDHLDHYGTLVPCLRDSGVSAWVVRGDRDEIGLTDEERRELVTSPNVTMVTIPDAAHLILTDQPALTAELILTVTTERT